MRWLEHFAFVTFRQGLKIPERKLSGIFLTHINLFTAALLAVLVFSACNKKSGKNKINTVKGDEEGAIFNDVTEAHGTFGSGELKIAQATAKISEGTFNPKVNITMKKAEKGVSEASGDEILAVSWEIKNLDGSAFNGEMGLPIDMALKAENISNQPWAKIGLFDPDSKALKSLIKAEDLTLTETETGKFWISFPTTESRVLFIAIDPMYIAPEFTINEEAEFTNTASVKLDFAASTSSYTERRIGSGEDCSQGIETPDNSASLDWTLSSGDGEKTLCVSYANFWGDSVSSTATIFLDTTPPTSAILISGDINADYTAGNNTTLIGTATDLGSGIEKVDVALSNDDGTTCLDADKGGFNTACPVWHTPEGIGEWALTIADDIFVDGHSYSIYSKTLDRAGNEQAALSSSVFTWDITPPVAVISGQPTDVSNTVALDIDVLDTTGLVSYKYKLGLTESTDCNAAADYSSAFIEEATNIVVNISTINDGVIKLCVIGRDAAGNTQELNSPTEALWAKDTIAPTVDVGDDIITNQTEYINAQTSDVHAMTYAWTKTNGNGGITFSAPTAEDTDVTADSNILYILRLTATDEAGNVGYDDLYFTWDTLPPNPDFYINSDVSYTNSTNVALSFFNTTDIHEYRTAEGSDCSGATYTSYSTNPVAFTLSGGDGSKTVCMQVRDANNNESGVPTDTIILDTAEPDTAITTSGTIGPEVTAGITTTLSGTATDTLSGVDTVQVSLEKQSTGLCLNDTKDNFNQVCPHWLDAVGTYDWILSVNDAIFGDGLNYNLSSKAFDQASNEQSTPTTTVLTWDATPPDPTFAINSADPFTNNITVSIDITNTAGVAYYRKANGASCAAASWVAFSANPMAHTLSTGDADKTVCLEVKDAVGNVSSTATSMITLDTTQPNTVLNVPAFLGPSSTAGANTDFSGTATDAVSNTRLQLVEISIQHIGENCFDATETDFSGACEVWHAATGTDTFSYSVPDAKFVHGDSYIVKARASDLATNVETSLASATFTWDTVAPNPSFAINSGDSYTNSTTVDLDLVDTSNIYEYRLANGTDCSGATWTPFVSSPISHSLTGGDAVKDVCLEVRDNLSNASGTATDSITLDTSGPSINDISSPKANAEYTVGEVITINVDFNEIVNVTGTPILTLETGSPDRDASYTSGDGTSTLTFTYTVEAGDTSADLDYVATTSLQLSGGSIKDNASNDATLTLFTPTAAHSLSANKDLIIDTTPPTLAGSMSQIATDTTLDITWPNAAGHTGFILVRRIGAAVSFSPTTGQSYSVGTLDADHELLYKGALLTFQDSSLSAGIDYHYSVWAYDNAGNYSAELTLSARVLFLTGARKVSQAKESVCILRSDSNIYCFGNGANGQLGYESLNTLGDDPNEIATLPPVNLGTNALVRDIFSGYTHRCVILMDGRVKCWGSNSSGELGLEHTNDIGDDAGEMGDNLPEVNLGTNKRARSLSLGKDFTCAILEDYSLKCWGKNASGQLGYGDTSTRGDSVGTMGDNLLAVNLGTGRKARQIASAATHSCAILDNGEVKCWGLGSLGQLGLEDTNTLGDEPGEMGDALPAVTFPTGLYAQRLFAGRLHMCSLMSDQSIRCWGDNTNHPLGLDLAATPPSDYIGNEAGEMGNNLPAINLGKDVIDLIKFRDHSCALLQDETLKCWGANASGALGYGDTTSRGDNINTMASLPADISLGTGLTAKPFSHDGHGYGFTCLVLSDSSVKCFGDNTFGQLGLGDTNHRGDGGGEMGDNLQKLYQGTATPSSIMSLASGADARHMCVVTHAGKLKCWGRGDYGQLGTGDTLARGDNFDEMGANLAYVDLGTGVRAQEVVVGLNHTCALLTTGMVKCFGQNNAGQLGLGDIVNRGDQAGEMGDNLPEVSLGTNVWARKLTTDRETTCILSNSSNVKCWGANTYGNLGIGDSLDRGVQGGEMGDNLGFIDLGTGFNNSIRDILGSSYATCAINYAGQVKCWGRGTYGLIGGGNSTHRGDGINEMGDNLAILPLSDTVISGEGASFHNCLLSSDGGLKCFGYGAMGRLGYENINTLGDGAGEIAGLGNVSLGTNFFVNKLDASGTTSCVSSLEGTLKCWGNGIQGETGYEVSNYLGDEPGEMGDNLNTIDLGSSVLVRDVTGITTSTCILSSDYRLKCFGYNGNGVLGLENTTQLGDEPGEMGDNLPWVEIE